MRGASACLVFAGIALYAHTASAEYRFCNETSYVLDSAVAYEDGERGFVSKGWFRLYPGSCLPVLAKPLTQDVYYVYARSLSAHSGPPHVFGGRDTFCIDNDTRSFEIESRIHCQEKAGFMKHHVFGKKWTKIFSEHRRYESRRHSKVAGIQRLLQDNRFEVGDIDGYAGSVTLNLVKVFQRQVGLRATGVITDRLFGALISKAAEKYNGIGLRICNETTYSAWSAYGARTIGPDPEYLSRGWVHIKPKDCSIIIHDRLARDVYYTYTEALDENGVPIRRNGEALVWGGGFVMCVKDTLFRISGRTECGVRGFDKARFRKIETGGAPGWTQYLRE